MSDKKAIRCHVRKLRDGMPEGYRNEKNSDIIKNILSLPEYKTAKDILIYVSTGSEADTHELIRKCFADKKNVYVPKVYDRKNMRFIKISSLEELDSGYYGILEPVADAPVWSPKTESDECDGICIMPGVAFDRGFNRIGYGGGFYDRFLEIHKNIKKLAVCFECQLIEDIEDVSDTDIRPDVIVTDVEVLRNGQY